MILRLIKNTKTIILESEYSKTKDYLSNFWSWANLNNVKESNQVILTPI